MPVLTLVVLGCALQVNATSYAEFPADAGAPGGLLRTAVDAYCASSDPNFTFSSGGNDYGPIKDWRTGLVTNMRELFLNKFSCDADISNWDTSSATDMYGMFQRANQFSADLSGWDTSSVEDMENMFFQAYQFNADIGAWDTAEVTNMAGMFFGASKFNRDLSNWNIVKLPTWITCSQGLCHSTKTSVHGNLTSPTVALPPSALPQPVHSRTIQRRTTWGHSVQMIASLRPSHL